MIIQWNSTFDSAQMLWLLLATIILSVTLLPALSVLMTHGAVLSREILNPVHWLTCAVVNAVAWILLFYSLAFGPSLGTMPEAAAAETPKELEVMIREAGEVVDQRHLFGRGGILGDLQFAGFRGLESQGNAEEPLFSSRRPHHDVSLMAVLGFQMIVYLTAVLAVGAVVSQYTSPARTLVYSLLWGACVYVPVAHWVWGDGWLSLRGVMDTGGGLLVLVVSVAALAIIPFRHSAVIEPSRPDDLRERVVLPVIVAFFWLGSLVLMCSFRMPSPHLRAIAFFNGVLAPCTGCLLYLLLQTLSQTRDVSSSPLTGVLCGIAAIAPGCLLFDARVAMMTGGAGAAVGFIAWRLCVSRNCPLRLESSLTSAAAAATGMLAVGVFGSSTNGMFHWNQSPILSLMHGDSRLIAEQAASVASIACFTFLVSYILQWIIVVPKTKFEMPQGDGSIAE